MKPSREEVHKHFIEVLESLDADETLGEITDETLLIGEMKWRSVEIIYLANAMQEHYGQTLPFNDLFEVVSEREPADISVGEWIDFVHQHLGEGEEAATR